MTDTLVREFHEAFGLDVRDGLGPVTPDLARLRLRLIREEYEEVRTELETVIANGSNFDKQRDPLVRLAKELADLRYVVDGTAVSLGIDLAAVFREVHSSNMSKLGEDGKPVYREDGKVLKGPNYREADVESALTLPVEAE